MWQLVHILCMPYFNSKKKIYIYINMGIIFILLQKILFIKVDSQSWIIKITTKLLPFLKWETTGRRWHGWSFDIGFQQPFQENQNSRYSWPRKENGPIPIYGTYELLFGCEILPG